MRKRTVLHPEFALCLALGLLLVGLLGDAVSADSLPPAPTATASLDLQVRIGFDGYYKAGGWLPVSALARNDGPPLNGRLTLGGGISPVATGSYSAAAILPTHSQKRLYVAAAAPGADRSRTVALTAGNQTVLTQTLPVSALSPQDYLYGVISPNSDALDLLRGVRQFDGTIAVAHLSLDDLPASGPALNDVDAMVLDNTATSALTDDQRQTLLAWVSSGGQLVLGGGTGAAQTLAGLADAAPISVGNTQVLDVGAALAPWTHSTAPDRTTVAVGQPADGSIVRLRAGNVPLVVDRPYGDGWVTFLAMPAATPALHDAPGGVLGWQHILTASRHRLDGLQTAASSPSFGQTDAVYALPQAALPSGQLLGWLVMGYIAMVGPVNYLLLRRLDRRELLWLTIPLVSLLFAAGSYGLASQLKGSDVIVNTVTVARHGSGPAALASVTIEGAVGIFSPGRTAYDLQIGGGLGISPLEPTLSTTNRNTFSVVGEGTTSLVQGIRVEKWSMQAFAVHGSSAASAARAPVETALSLTGSTVVGWVRNSGNTMLQDVLLVIGNDNQALGNLSPGEQRTIRLVLSGSVAPVGGPPGRPPTLANVGSYGDRRMQNLLSSVLSGRSAAGSTTGAGGGPQVYAFGSAAPFSVVVEQHRVQQHDLTLHVTAVPVDLSQGTGTLPYGFAQRELLQNSGVGTQFGGPWLPLGSTAAFQFRLPASQAGRSWSALHVRLAMTSFGRTISTAGGGPTLALYNWDSATWDAQSGFTQGVQTILQPAHYADGRGLIRLQLSGGNGQQQLQTLDVALDTTQ